MEEHKSDFYIYFTFFFYFDSWNCPPLHLRLILPHVIVVWFPSSSVKMTTHHWSLLSPSLLSPQRCSSFPPSVFEQSFSYLFHFAKIFHCISPTSSSNLATHFPQKLVFAPSSPGQLSVKPPSNHKVHLPPKSSFSSWTLFTNRFFFSWKRKKQTLIPWHHKKLPSTGSFYIWGCFVHFLSPTLLLIPFPALVPCWGPSSLSTDFPFNNLFLYSYNLHVSALWKLCTSSSCQTPLGCCTELSVIKPDTFSKLYLLPRVLKHFQLSLIFFFP